jgi:hypothetical protein
MRPLHVLALAALALGGGVLLGWLILQPVTVNNHFHVASPTVQAVVPVVMPFPGLAAPAPALATTPADSDPPAVGIAGGPLRDRLGFVGLRGRLRAELDRRAGLPEGDPHRITAEQQDKGKELVGKLGDGHLLDLLVKYGPTLLKLAEAILALLAVL